MTGAARSLCCVVCCVVHGVGHAVAQWEAHHIPHIQPHIGTRRCGVVLTALAQIRLQLTKPGTWIPLIWGVACGAAASGNYHAVRVSHVHTFADMHTHVSLLSYVP